MKVSRQRHIYESALRNIPVVNGSANFERVLIDASWDNPNYWYRLTLLRAGLNLPSALETAVTGPYRAKEARRAVRALGIPSVLKFEQHFPSPTALDSEAKALLDGLSSPSQILEWQLPFGFPAALLYDGLLKRQRTAEVDIAHPMLVEHVTEALGSIRAAEALISRVDPDLVILSHVIEFRYGSLAWCALRKGATVIAAFGNYGSPRFARLREPGDIYNWADRPTASQIDALAQNAEVVDKGERYLHRRLAGLTDDLGGRFAFSNQKGSLDRHTICDFFGWNPDSPIVAVYASNWFDYPHSFGMSEFRDFLDWQRRTLEAALESTACNWLFRAHPCDQWYGGITLSDLMVGAPAPHVRLCPADWNGADVQTSVDGLVTVFGTAGIEYAAAGKPVLLADRGWYHDLGFASFPGGRNAYLAALRSLHWLNRPHPDSAVRAKAFAAAYFGLASEVALGDDSEQDRLLPTLITLLRDRGQFVASQASAVGAWWASGTPHFHTWQMIQHESGRP